MVSSRALAQLKAEAMKRFHSRKKAFGEDLPDIESLAGEIIPSQFKLAKE